MSMEINGLNARQTTSSGTQTADKVGKTDLKTEPESPAPSEPKATVVISDEAKSLSKLSSQVSSEAPVDSAKVEALKAAVNDGSYKPNAEGTAGGLLDTDDLF
ncbi:MAG: flagellar biosynthesis anti-sigma factor FlgM [Gammaproteobacteria bacterium]|nr:flagellar biosynthesis anti-sigma factor FlgM [Gammaproteobacteria bacterium]